MKDKETILALVLLLIVGVLSQFLLLIEGEFVKDISDYDFSTSTFDLWIVSSVLLGIGAGIDFVLNPRLSRNICAALAVLFAPFWIVKLFLFHKFGDVYRISCLVLDVVISTAVLIIKYRLLKNQADDFRYSEQATPLIKENIEKTSKPSVARLLKTLKPEKWTLAAATVALIISTICNLAQPYYFGKMISVCSSEDGDVKSLNVYTEILVALNVIGMISTSARGWLYSLVGERVVRDMRKNLFENIVKQDVSFFDVNKTGELINRLASDTAVLQGSLSTNISLGLRNFASIIASIVLLFITSWKLTLVMMGVVPALVVCSLIFGRYAKKLTKGYQDALAAASDIGSENIANSRIMKSFGAEVYASNQYFNQIKKSYDIGAKKALGYGIFVGGIGTMANMAIIVVVYYGAVLVINGDLNVGALTAFVLYTIYIAVGMGFLGNLYAEFMTAVGASERIYEILETNPKIPSSGGIWPTETKGHIELCDVSFRYPTRPDIEVLNSFNLNINPYQTVALVGASGAGKSTVLCLLERFYDVDGGKILIDGIDIRELDPRYLHRIVSIVPQEPVLFSGSIRSNIIYSKLAAYPESAVDEKELCSDDDVIQAAKQANAHDFIMRFPEGYDTLVGERGVRLSGGQKQRIAIARALLADPKILLLDEATSALDAESEHLVQEAIDRLMLHRTVIVIAHRLSTVRDANVIVVFSKESGKGVVDAASHDVLLDRCEEYRSLVHRQLQGKEPPPAPPASAPAASKLAR